MPVQIINPLAQVVEGVQNAVMLADRLRRTAQDRQEFEHRKERYAQEAQARDLNLRGLLQNITRPVEAGTVSDQLHGLAEGNPLAAAIQIRRPVDKSRLLRPKLSTGQTIEGELLTPEEQAQRQLQMRLREADALSGQKASDAVKGRQAMLKAFGIDVANPAGGSARVLPGEVDDVGRGFRNLLPIDQDAPQSVGYATDDQGRRTVTIVSKRGRITEKKLSGLGKSKAPPREGGDVQSRFEQRALDTAEKEMSSLQDKEQDAWADVEKYKTQLAEKARPDRDGNLVPMNSILEASWKNQEKAARAKATGYAKRQQDIRKKFKLGEFTQGTTPAAGSPAPAQPQYKPGDIVRKGGKSFKVLAITKDGMIQAQPLD